MSNDEKLEQKIAATIVEAKIAKNPILGNAWRLAQDAHLLFENKRYATALALGALSFEEIGKYLLTEWEKDDKEFTYDKRRLHQMKQAAIAALYMTDTVRKEYKTKNINFKNLSDQEELKLLEAIREGVKKGRPFGNLVLAKAYEYAKWSGMYYDEEFASKGIEPTKITADNAKEIIGISARSFMLLADPGNVLLAKGAFPIVLDPSVS